MVLFELHSARNYVLQQLAHSHLILLQQMWFQELQYSNSRREDVRISEHKDVVL